MRNICSQKALSSEEKAQKLTDKKYLNNGKNTEPVIEDESKEKKEAVIEIKEKETDNGKLRILDVGCGTGFLPSFLQNRGTM
ncbi:MAG: hypothetical protein ACLTER_25745 [Ruminococcus sp.]